MGSSPVSPIRQRFVSAALGALRSRSPGRAGTSGRRAVLLHLDGVSRNALQHAIRTAHMPFLSRLIASRSHQCTGYTVGAPASTAAFQAGLLYGAVDDVPGYLWYDKKRGRPVRMDSSDDVVNIENRHGGRGPGLLAGGVSYTTLFSGGADVPALNLARVKKLQWHSNGRHWPFATAAAVHSLLGLKIYGRLALEGPSALLESLVQAARVGRFDWEWRLFGMKLLGIGLTEIATWGTAVEMARGVPIIYTCLVAYDEVAHRRGPLAPEALEYLREIDASIETVFAAAEAFPELGYDVYVLADHGMVDATPFASLDGRDLPAFLRGAADGEGASEGHARMRQMGDRLPPPLGWAVHQVARKHAVPPRGVEIIDAGDIAHLYFTDHRHALPLSAIERLQPRIVAALRASPSIPFFVARSEGGPVIADRKHVYRLTDSQQRGAAGELPAIRGRDRELLLSYLERVISMPSAGDVVLYGNHGPGRNVAFSWEFGSHGGIGAEEIEAFVIHPRSVDFDFGAVRRPEQLHHWFVRYRPQLPGQQDRASDLDAVEPERRRRASEAVRDGVALVDPSEGTLHTGCR